MYIQCCVYIHVYVHALSLIEKVKALRIPQTSMYVHMNYVAYIIVYASNVIAQNSITVDH